MVVEVGFHASYHVVVVVRIAAIHFCREERQELVEAPFADPDLRRGIPIRGLALPVLHQHDARLAANVPACCRTGSSYAITSLPAARARPPPGSAFTEKSRTNCCAGSATSPSAKTHQPSVHGTRPQVMAALVQPRRRYLPPGRPRPSPQPYGIPDATPHAHIDCSRARNSGSNETMRWTWDVPDDI